MPNKVNKGHANKQIPNYSIERIRGADHTPEDLIAMRFSDYLASRGYLFQAHRHSFYHLVFFTKGTGNHSLDFVSFPVMPGQIYFMNPGQVHNWDFSAGVEGYIVNFSPRLFQSVLNNPQYPEQFSFFNGHAMDQVILLPKQVRSSITGLFEMILTELGNSNDFTTDMVVALLMQIFILINRLAGADRNAPSSAHGRIMLRNFRKLVEEHYLHKKLPKEYAALLYVTPNYLNSLCRDIMGISAGEIIRERVLLEAKRLLVNADMNIGEIAYQLDFPDNSYFTKFFKKYAGMTPEEFRKQYHIAAHS